MPKHAVAVNNKKGYSGFAVLMLEMKEMQGGCGCAQGCAQTPPRCCLGDITKQATRLSFLHYRATSAVAAQIPACPSPALSLRPCR
jgi:hypothetical protein